MTALRERSRGQHERLKLVQRIQLLNEAKRQTPREAQPSEPSAPLLAILSRFSLAVDRWAIKELVRHSSCLCTPVFSSRRLFFSLREAARSAEPGALQRRRRRTSFLEIKREGRMSYIVVALGSFCTCEARDSRSTNGIWRRGKGKCSPAFVMRPILPLMLLAAVSLLLASSALLRRS